jgi:coenzyme F420-reducing hydrogenase delta subunit
LLDEIGVGGERVQMYNLSSAEGAKFAEVCEEMTQKAAELGPSPLKGTKQEDDTPEAKAV